MDEIVLFAFHSKQIKLVRLVFGRIYGAPILLLVYLTFSSRVDMTFDIRLTRVRFPCPELTHEKKCALPKMGELGGMNMPKCNQCVICTLF